jgi:serine/threonine protein kinase
LPVRVRLGDFEFDLTTGELRNGSETVRLTEKPLRVLLTLVARGGELVAREELQKRLRPNDTIVDFEHGINAAMRVLRRALGDSADQPRYIETFARRGYRLIVPVEQLEGPPAASPVGAPHPRAQSGRSGLIGSEVAHYRVPEIIGGGGMGLVYKAEDLKLGRPVALKFLSEELVSDPVVLQRFEREARTASALNHPNICTIYEVEEHERQPFLVMELLEGETLRDRLAACGAQAVPSDRLIDIALQVCDGLQAAHQKGIIHRDIKPANIFLTTSGQVKILDFGLAKLVEAPEEVKVERGFSPASADSFFLSSPAERVSQETRDGEERGRSAQDDRVRGFEHTLTRTGLAMGTAGYMSPEQVRKEKLDARTDLFSFGLVLYEMTTGQRAFAGETAAVVQDAILHNSPVPVRALNFKFPPKLDAVIGKALEKDRERRYHSAAEMRTDLEQVRSHKRPAVYREKWLIMAAVLVLLALGSGQYLRLRRTLKLTANDTIVLADFVNSTSDPVFNEALNTALRVELEQTPFLNVLAPDKVRGTSESLNLPESQRLTSDVGREICTHTKSNALVIGSISDAGNHYQIDLKALNCVTGTEAANEFQKLLNYPDVVRRFVTGALSCLQLGRAQAMVGDKAAARKSYQDFLTLWKDADPDIPIYKQAKAEYASLR